LTLPDSTVDRLLRIAGASEDAYGRYALAEEIGRGGMGVVFRAHDHELRRDVALKVLRAGPRDLASRLHGEARVLASLEHPGIVPVHDVGVTGDGLAFYVMKLVRGKRLDQWASEGPSAAERLRVFERICEPVGFAHAHGIVHRDLKPANVMLGAFGEVLVMDWGVARLLADGDEPAGVVLGTPGYMAPEQAAGGTVDARSDIHALGAILHFLMAGEHPGGAGLPPRTPAAVAAIIRRCLAADPAARYASVIDLAADVRAFQAGEAVTAFPESPMRAARRLAFRYRVPIALVVAYMVMRVALILWTGR
jgi:serine/threonine protein kinase